MDEDIDMQELRDYEVSLNSLSITDLLTSGSGNQTLTSMDDLSEDRVPHVERDKEVTLILKKLTDQTKQIFELQTQKVLDDLEIENVRCALSSKEKEFKDVSVELIKLKTEAHEKALKIEKNDQFLTDLDRILSTRKLTGAKAGIEEAEKRIRGSSPVSPADIKAKLERKLHEVEKLRVQCRDSVKRKDEYRKENHDLKRELEKASHTHVHLYWNEVNKRREIGENLRKQRQEMFGLHANINEYRERVETKDSEIETLNEKVKILQAELDTVRRQSKDELTKMKAEVLDRTKKLEIHEKKQNATDNVVLKAVAVPDCLGLLAMLKDFNEGSALTSEVRRGLEQAFLLAQQVLTLERRVANQKNELSELWDDRERTRTIIDSYEGALAMAGNPLSELVICLSEKNTEITKLNSKVRKLEEELKISKEYSENICSSYGDLLKHQHLIGFQEVESNTGKCQRNSTCYEKASKPSSLLAHSETMIRHNAVREEYKGDADISSEIFEIPSDFTISEEEGAEEQKIITESDTLKRIQILPVPWLDEESSPRPGGRGRGRGRGKGIHGENSHPQRCAPSKVGFHHTASSSSALLFSKIEKVDEPESFS